MQSGDLDCTPSDVVISYVMHLREKVNPTIINSDVRVLTYIMDADADGFRPILRINMVERSFEGPLNSSAPPPRCSTVNNNLIDDDLNDYENDVDDTINMKDYSMHMEDFSSDSIPEHGYACFPAFSHMVKLLNPGSSYFIMKLKSIIEDEPDLCIISGKHISIANAFSRVYGHSHHGLCMRHLAEIFCVNQHYGEHRYLFYAAVKAYLFDEFSDNFVELKNKCPEAAYVLENVLGFEKWSRAHFSGNRYDVMTTNIAESLNSILMDEREYPMLYIFNSIAKKFSENFRERHTFIGGKENIFVPSAERILRDNKSASIPCIWVIQMGFSTSIRCSTMALLPRSIS
ncbi:hypothetical protein T459_04974 [Capsicum annuum]|uniref:MULE transposase domain-containing protein n=1 Tax=Capsicum annuum TaxID=4072 RepID=A0A2G3A6P4_CAPAN|nr:hypothetical protein T459_04974 [Capsicum annuum]